MHQYRSHVDAATIVEMEQPIIARPRLLDDGSHRGMNAGWTPEHESMTPSALRAAAPSTWVGLQPGRSKGVDSSHWNGTVVPSAGAAVYGIEWWAHKATEGTAYVDPSFRKAQADMRAARIPYRIWYHFPLNNRSIKDQVDHFLRTIGPLQVGEAAKLDDEAATGIGCLTIQQAREWHERVETATGRPTVQYTGGYVRNPADVFYHWDADVLREGLHGHRPNIFASYNSEQTSRSHARGKPWDVWQQSSSGILPGIQSGGISVIDLDRVDFLSAYDAACGYDTSEPIPPEPTPTPTPVPPLPPGDAEMSRALLRCADANAAFFAWTDPQGIALQVEWTGPGDDPNVVRRIDAQMAAGCQVHQIVVANLIGVSLVGPLPTGDTRHQWTGREFGMLLGPT